MASPASPDAVVPDLSAVATAPAAAPACAAELAVEVAYALPDRQTLLALSVAVGCTVEQAIRQSGILSRHPEIDLTVNTVGIWSRAVPLQQPLQTGDRIEIYRPLLIDPKSTLRQREKAKRRR